MKSSREKSQTSIAQASYLRVGEMLRDVYGSCANNHYVQDLNSSSLRCKDNPCRTLACSEVSRSTCGSIVVDFSVNVIETFH